VAFLDHKASNEKSLVAAVTGAFYLTLRTLKLNVQDGCDNLSSLSCSRKGGVENANIFNRYAIFLKYLHMQQSYLITKTKSNAYEF
jgi:hypothetical protein